MGSAKPRGLRGGVTPHKLTTEQRRRGAEKANEVKRAKREAIEARAIDMVAAELVPSLQTLVDIRDNAETTPDRRQSAQYLIDRHLGKPAQRTELSGPDGDPITVEVAQTRERLFARLADRASRRGTE